MKFVIFDTETTGLPKSKLISPDTLHLWPHIVQLSYAIYDKTLNDVPLVKDYIINVDENVIIPEESIQFHGITKEISQSKGVPIEIALQNFFRELKTVDKLVGHNVSFDIQAVKVELMRLIHFNKQISNEIKTEMKFHFHYLTNYENVVCTMQESIDLCSIPALDRYGKQYNKWPRLSELHQKLFETQPNNLHNSLNDVLVTLRCFIKMTLDIDLNIECETFKNIAQTINLF